MNKHMELLANLKTMVETRKISGAAMLTVDTYNERIQACLSTALVLRDLVVSKNQQYMTPVSYTHLTLPTKRIV